MKFKINIKELRKAILPILEATGAAEKKHDINDYLQVSGKLINLCEESVESAIKSVLTNTDQESPAKAINKCCAYACSAIRKKLFPLKRVTITANKNKFVALASEGNVTARVTISAKDFEGKGYECQQQGQLTLEPDYLKALLKNTRNWGTVVIANADNNTVKVYPESEDGGIHHFSVLSYHVKAKIPSKAKTIGVIDKSILIRSFRAVLPSISNKSKYAIYNCIGIRIYDNKMVFYAGDGKIFSSYTVDGVSVKSDKSIDTMLGGNDIEGIVKALVALKDDKVVIKFKGDCEENYIIFVQGKTQIAVCCHYDAEKYPPVLDLFDYEYKYAFRTKLSNWSDYVGKTIKPASKAYPFVEINADIEKGHFLVRHCENFRYQTPIRFIYGSDVKYYDPAKINKDEMLMTCYSWDVLKMIDNGSYKDVISIEFGANGSQAITTKANKILKYMLKVRYPVRQVRKTETTEQLILTFYAHVKISE